jgi:hypothetical protein
MDIHDHSGFLGGEVLDCVPVLLRSNTADIGNLSMEYHDKLRELAIIELLTFGIASEFYKELNLSGSARKTYLTRCRDEGLDKEVHRVSGRYEPLLDTLAAGDFDLAGAIAELSLSDYRQGYEHEGDYCYAQILHRLVKPTPPADELTALLDRFDSIAEPQLNTRKAILRALAEKDPAAFEQAFGALLDEFKAENGEYQEWDCDKFEEMHEEDADETELLNMLDDAKQQVFIEGLALLRLAEKSGLETKTDYPYCPAIVRAKD